MKHYEVKQSSMGWAIYCSDPVFMMSGLSKIQAYNLADVLNRYENSVRLLKEQLEERNKEYVTSRQSGQHTY